MRGKAQVREQGKQQECGTGRHDSEQQQRAARHSSTVGKIFTRGTSARRGGAYKAGVAAHAGGPLCEGIAPHQARQQVQRPISRVSCAPCQAVGRRGAWGPDTLVGP